MVLLITLQWSANLRMMEAFAILRSLSESWRAKHSQHSDGHPASTRGHGRQAVYNQRQHVRERLVKDGDKGI